MKIPNPTVISLIIPLFFLALATSSPSQCPLSSDEVNKQTLQQFTIPCLEKALIHGWTQVINHLVNQRQDQHREQFIALLQQELKRLQILEEDIVLGSSETQPILKWGQNRTHVFITFKLSHRWDSPPCLYTQAQQSRLEQDAFFYNNVCVVSHQKVNFKVNLNLYRSVMLSMKDAGKRQEVERKDGKQQGQEDSEDSSQKQMPPKHPEPTIQAHTNYSQYQFDVKKDGVGQYSTILLKKIPQIWIFLTKEQKSYPTWHEISQRFPQEFNQYEQSLSTHRFVQRQKDVKEAAERETTNSSSSFLRMLIDWWTYLWR